MNHIIMQFRYKTGQNPLHPCSHFPSAIMQQGWEVQMYHIHLFWLKRRVINKAVNSIWISHDVSKMVFPAECRSKELLFTISLNSSCFLSNWLNVELWWSLIELILFIICFSTCIICISKLSTFLIVFVRRSNMIMINMDRIAIIPWFKHPFLRHEGPIDSFIFS